MIEYKPVLTVTTSAAVKQTQANGAPQHAGANTQTQLSVDPQAFRQNKKKSTEFNKDTTWVYLHKCL